MRQRCKGGNTERRETETGTALLLELEGEEGLPQLTDDTQKCVQGAKNTTPWAAGCRARGL